MAVELEPWETRANLLSYLTAHHDWRAVPATIDAFTVWEHQTGARAFIPKHENWADYRLRANDALREIAYAENRSIIRIAINVGGFIQM